CAERSRKVDRASGAEAAFHPDPPLHQLDDAPRNGQSEAGPAELACRGGIDLGIRGEDMLTCPLRNPTPCVAYCELQSTGGTVLGVRFDPNDHFPLLRELDRIPDEIDEDLSEPRRIAYERCRDFRGDAQPQLEPLFVGADGHDFESLVQNLA